jgi:hypothetical protein
MDRSTKNDLHEKAIAWINQIAYIIRKMHKIVKKIEKIFNQSIYKDSITVNKKLAQATK